MRLPIVARSLGIILASPLVALPTGAAGDGAELPPRVLLVASSAASPADAAAAPADPPSATQKKKAPSRAPRAELEVSVTCGRRGCVVQDGLAVTVVETSPYAATAR